ncbi:MAG: imidazole glycerol phosphate synthase subunit HisH [Desulfovibrio sp.]
MLPVRIIPRLDVKGNNLVKGVHLEGLRVLGLPEHFAKEYYQAGADELIYMDVVASLYGRNNLEDVIRRTAESIFIPITAGGGVRSIEDVRKLLRAGADKVAINTAATKNPELIREVAEVFGSQCMVLSVEAIKSGPGQYQVYTDNGREPTGRDVLDWVRQAVELGAGEILLTSVDQEGTGQGYDLDLVRMVTNAVSIPVIAHGGAGKPAHVADLLKNTDASAACCSSIIHYHLLEDMGIHKREEGNVDYLKQFVRGGKSVLDIFQTTDVGRLKRFLVGEELKCVCEDAESGSDDGFVAPAVIKLGGTVARPKVRVGIPEYGRGNLFSLEQALRYAGGEVVVTSDPDDLARCDKLVLAGVGSFSDCMSKLNADGLGEAVRELASSGTPLLGICLGMQLLFERGHEFGMHQGLGLLPGDVVQMRGGAGSDAVRIPHIGWNSIRPTEALSGPAWELLKNVSAGDRFYFVHSFMVAASGQDFQSAVTSYGPNRFCSVVVRENLFGCQFHPERSGLRGLHIYENWIKL